jgi:hypothetical protein
MPSLKQDVILQIEGNRKAFLKLEMGMTRGGLPASGNVSAQEQELRRLRTRTPALHNTRTETASATVCGDVANPNPVSCIISRIGHRLDLL